MTTARTLTPEEQLRKAHLPSAQDAVLDLVKRNVDHDFGAFIRWTRNRDAWEVPEVSGLSPNRFWMCICTAIAFVSARSNILESDTRELMEWARKRQWVSGKTLEELNVALGGRVGAMARNYYGV